MIVFSKWESRIVGTFRPEAEPLALQCAAGGRVDHAVVHALLHPGHVEGVLGGEPDPLLGLVAVQPEGDAVGDVVVAQLAQLVEEVAAGFKWEVTMMDGSIWSAI